MNKLVLATLLFIPIWTNVYSKYSIEQAIQEGNKRAVQSFLKEEYEFSDYDKKRLLDLAQGVIKKRHSEWKAYAGFWGISLNEALFFCISTLLNTYKTHEVGKIVWSAILFSLPCIVIKRIAYDIKYNRLYNNALEIKQLIHKTIISQYKL